MAEAKKKDILLLEEAIAISLSAAAAVQRKDLEEKSDDEDDDALLAQAISLSLVRQVGETIDATKKATTKTSDIRSMFSEINEIEELVKILQSFSFTIKIKLANQNEALNVQVFHDDTVQSLTLRVIKNAHTLPSCLLEQ